MNNQALLEHYAENDPLYKFKQAFYEGKRVETYWCGKWLPIGANPAWTNSESGYRIVPEPKTVPMTVEDLPPVCWIKYKSQPFRLVVGVEIGDQSISWAEREWFTMNYLVEHGALHSTDRKNWLPLTKEIEE